jgi:gluconolactonase
MKKRFFFCLGVLCVFGFNSCQKRIQESPEMEPTEASGARKHPGESNFFDPTHLVSYSQHGKLDTLATGFKFTEGPAVDRHGNVFFTDQPDDRIYRWDARSGKVTLFLQGTGRSNGMAFDKHGNLIACADMYGELWKIRPDGSHEVLVDNYKGHKLNGPNDVWINPVTGGIYITDPMFPRGYWLDSDPRKVNNPGWPPVWSDQGPGIAGHVYYLAPRSKKLVRVTTMMGWSAADSWPNGIVGTPDGKKLYINKWAGDNKGGTWSFHINWDGTLSNMKKVTDWGGDGMSMDELGNFYISNGEGLMAFDKRGNNILKIPTGGGATNNVFAGKNNKLLIITGGGLSSPPWPNNQDRVTAVKMNVKGVEMFK